MPDGPRIRSWVTADGRVGTLRIDMPGQPPFQVDGDLRAWADLATITANTRDVMLARQTGVKPCPEGAAGARPRRQ